MAAHVAAVVKSKNIGNAIKITDKIKKKNGNNKHI